MARPLRLVFKDGLYHVTARGNGRQPIFEDDTDRESFLAVLASTVARYHVLCHAYCLMGNHYHLLLETPEANLSRAMRQLNGVYGQRFARRHERPGHVLQGRFHAQVVDRDAYLREVCRYIVLNPVRACLVTHPERWPWSSYRATAGEAPVPAFLTVDWVLSLGDTPVRTRAEHRYRQFVEAGLVETANPLEPVNSGLVMGDADFLVRLRERAPDPATLVEVPRAQRFALRPALAALFTNVMSKGDRDARCALAVREHGYTMKEIAEFLGLHYSTVSRALSRGAGEPAASRVLDFKT
jgi:putative transposase